MPGRGYPQSLGPRGARRWLGGWPAVRGGGFFGEVGIGSVAGNGFGQVLELDVMRNCGRESNGIGRVEWAAASAPHCSRWHLFFVLPRSTRRLPVPRQTGEEALPNSRFMSKVTGSLRWQAPATRPCRPRTIRDARASGIVHPRGRPEASAAYPGGEFQMISLWPAATGGDVRPPARPADSDRGDRAGTAQHVPR